jgi:TrmH family RNA methyltransferase
LIAPQYIESLKNPKIKQFKKWRDKSRERKKDGTFVAEGLQECRMAFQAGYEISFVLFCPDFIEMDQVLDEVPEVSNAEYLQCSTEVLNELTMRKDVKNIFIVGKQKSHELSELKDKEEVSYLICDAVEKPGNLGAIARSAHALGISAIILSNPLCDIYNPNAILSSTGSVFSIPIFTGSREQIHALLESHQIETFVTHMHSNAEMLTALTIPKKSAWVIGTENTGLDDSWLSKNYRNVLIPMTDEIDSLNVSNAAAILMYEVARQRA